MQRVLLGSILVAVLGWTPALGATRVESARASLQYLRRVMDEFHGRFPVYDDVSSPGNHFHAYAKIPDENARVEMNGSWTGTVHSGATSIRAQFMPGPPYFGGFYFQNGTLHGTETSPKANFGSIGNAGIDLTGATALTFWARGAAGNEQLEFFVAGVGWNAETNHQIEHFPDSSIRRPARGTIFHLTREWQQFRIDLTTSNMRYVLGGFGWVADTDHNPAGAVFFLDDIQFEINAERRAQRLNEPRFLRSFTTLPLQPDPFDAVADGDIDFVLRNLAFSYDNALALLAFLAEDSADGTRRARLIGDAFVYAAGHDRRYNDNRACNQPINNLGFDGARIRTAYAAGDLALPPGWVPLGRAGTVPIPGFYAESTKTFYEIEQQALDAGNNAWVAIALLGLYQRTGVPAYLDTACKIANFLHTFRRDSGTFQGFTGGVEEPEGSPRLRPWASLEHNLDLYAMFTQLYRITGESRWKDDADHARRFIDAMWDAERRCYLAGTTDPSNRNTAAGMLPLDVQPWSVLSLGGGHTKAIDCAEAHHLNDHEGFHGFDFNDDEDGVWFEGTAQMATAYALAQREAMADLFRAGLRRAQVTAPFGDGEGLAASTRDGLTTGFGFKYFRRLHIGATAWNVFAQLGFNPYYGQFIAPRSRPAMRR
jgi:hypothetical protein